MSTSQTLTTRIYFDPQLVTPKVSEVRNQFNEIYNEAKSTEEYIIQKRLTGLQVATPFGEGQAPATQLFTKQQDYRINFVKVGLKVPMTWEEQAMGQYPGLHPTLEQLRLSIEQENARSAFNYIARGFTGSTNVSLCANGLSLFNSAHTIPGGYTFSNVVSSTAGASVTLIKEMMSNLHKQTSPNGIIKSVGNDKYILLCASSKAFDWETVIYSQLQAGTSNNDMNPFKNRVTVRGVGFLEQVAPNACFLIPVDKSAHALTIVRHPDYFAEITPDAHGNKDLVAFSLRAFAAYSGHNLVGNSGA